MGKYYTYRITFPGFPWFYYGVHKCKGKPYFGSPKTHKWIWDFYDCEIQILQWFDSAEDAHALEQRLIRPFLNHPHCLNERCGGRYSDEHQKRAGLKSFELGAGIHSLSNEEKIEYRRQGGKESMRVRMELDPLCQSKSAKKAGELAVLTGQLANITTPENQSKGRETCRKLGIGVFNPESRKKAGDSTAKLKHQCPCCGKISTPGGMGRHLLSPSNECNGKAIVLL